MGLDTAATCCLAALIAIVAATACAQAAEPLRLAQTIALPNVAGRIDHLAIDLSGQRLFVAALGNNTIEVIDLRTAKRSQSVSALHEPQGVAYLPDLNKLFVANGANGVLSIFDGTSLAPRGEIRLSADADNVRYDAATKRLYVGYGDGGVGIVDPATNARVGDVQLPGHPESFQLETAGHRLFVNVPTANQIAVIDRQQGAVIATWPVADARANFPMALDEADHRLFVGFRHPARLTVFDTESGKPVTQIAIGGDTDDLFYDAARRRIYVSCGAGVLDIVNQHDPDHYVAAAQVPTTAGARTALFVPQLNRLYLAVPRHGTLGAEVRVYDVLP